jgi:hypothetical protein
LPLLDVEKGGRRRERMSWGGRDEGEEAKGREGGEEEMEGENFRGRDVRREVGKKEGGRERVYTVIHEYPKQ